MPKEITKNMSFREILEKYPELAEFFLEKGMHCIGCPMAMHETLEQGCLAHGLNPNDVVKKLNEKLKNDR